LKLTFGGKIANSTRENTGDECGPNWDITGARSGSDETSDGPRAEADEGKLALEPEIKNAPSEARDGSDHHGVPCGEDSPHVGTKGGTGIETQPSKPVVDEQPEKLICQ
jgi:hypothetical protein